MNRTSPRTSPPDAETQALATAIGQAVADALADRLPPARGEAIMVGRGDAADRLGMSLSHFNRHVAPFVRCVYLGRRSLYPVRELERWVDERARAAVKR